MLKVGLLVGREWSFPPRFIEEVNRRDEGVLAEYVKLGGTAMDGATKTTYLERVEMIVECACLDAQRHTPGDLPRGT